VLLKAVVVNDRINMSKTFVIFLDRMYKVKMTVLFHMYGVFLRKWREVL
jgi:hypothetical protein